MISRINKNFRKSVSKISVKSKSEYMIRLDRKNVFVLMGILLFITVSQSSAQDKNTVTADELIDLFSPKNNTAINEEEKAELGRTRSIGKRGIGGIRTGYSNSQPSANINDSESSLAPLQPSQNEQQQLPQYDQLMENDQSGIEVRKSFQNILFDVNAYTIKSSSYNQLDEIGKALTVVMSQDVGSLFIIEGHTDNSGSSEYNEKLSMKRAQMVRDFLLFKYGLDAKRLMALGYGENKPIASNENEFGRSLNRRVEIVRR